MNISWKSLNNDHLNFNQFIYLWINWNYCQTIIMYSMCPFCQGLLKTIYQFWILPSCNSLHLHFLFIFYRLLAKLTYLYLLFNIFFRLLWKSLTLNLFECLGFERRLSLLGILVFIQDVTNESWRIQLLRLWHFRSLS